MPRRPRAAAYRTGAGPDVVLTAAILPTRNRKRMLTAVPYALEEQLISDIDDLALRARQHRQARAGAGGRGRAPAHAALAGSPASGRTAPRCADSRTTRPALAVRHLDNTLGSTAGAGAQRHPAGLRHRSRTGHRRAAQRAAGCRRQSPQRLEVYECVAADPKLAADAADFGLELVAPPAPIRSPCSPPTITPSRVSTCCKRPQPQ